jgi:N-acetylneuraminate synthase
VGEVAQAHDGSLGTAHSFIDAIGDAGADAVKFQTHIAAAESTAAEPFRVQFARQDASRYDYWKRMEFTEEQWMELAEHARERGLIFLSSPFSVEATDLLVRVGTLAWKIASGEVTNTPMLQRMAETGNPILLSTGMSPLSEIDKMVQVIRDLGAPILLFQSTTSYPCPPEKIGLNMISLFRDRYGCPVGLSDHSGTIYAGLAAATVGIDILEVHVAFHRSIFGPDVPASLTPEELKQLVEGIRFVETMRQNPVDKDAVASDLSPLRDLFFKSVVASTDIPAGSVLNRSQLTTKKPGMGIPADRLDEVVGRTLVRDMERDEAIREEDLAAPA